MIITEWETRTYIASYVVEVDESGDEISDRINIDNHFKETWDSGLLYARSIEEFKKLCSDKNVRGRLYHAVSTIEGRSRNDAVDK